MATEAQGKGGGQDVWHREIERAAAEVAAAGVRVEAASQESRAAVTALQDAVVALEAVKQSAPGPKARPPPQLLPPQQSARPAPGAKARPPPPPPPPQQSARPELAARARPPTPPPLPRPRSTCIRHECLNAVANSESGSRCAMGHALCASCTTQYVKETLRSQGTVLWDRMVCIRPECMAYMGGVGVQNCISHGLVASIDAAQLRAAPSIAPEYTRGFSHAAGAAGAKFPEHDRASEAAIVELFKPCPKCNVPTEKVGGSDHLTCAICQHDYYWSCQCVFPTTRHVSCVPR